MSCSMPVYWSSVANHSLNTYPPNIQSKHLRQRLDFPVASLIPRYKHQSPLHTSTPGFNASFIFSLLSIQRFLNRRYSTATISFKVSPWCQTPSWWFPFSKNRQLHSTTAIPNVSTFHGWYRYKVHCNNPLD